MYGAGDRNLKLIRDGLGVGVVARDGQVRIEGDVASIEAARVVMDKLVEASRANRTMPRPAVMDAIAEAGWRAQRGGDVVQATGGGWGDAWGGGVDVYANGRPVTARTENQGVYLDAIRDNDLVFAIGPAGTGKTYVAVAAAIHMLKRGMVRKVILARPAVEAGEKLGFLPGDLFDKVNPYLRPLMDALHDMMDYATVKRFMQTDVVEVVPLAFMRGRTLNDAAIILDEAQNSTRGQMQMFLTRMGERSKMIITGDITQIDLDDPGESGLIDAVRRLGRTEGVGMCTLEKEDVVRHALVQRVIDAYDDEDGPAGASLEDGDG